MLQKTPQPKLDESIVWVAIVIGILVFLSLIGCASVRASSSLHPMRSNEAIACYTIRETGSERKIIVGKDRSLWIKKKDYE